MSSADHYSCALYEPEWLFVSSDYVHFGVRRLPHPPSLSDRGRDIPFPCQSVTTLEVYGDYLAPRPFLTVDGTSPSPVNLSPLWIVRSPPCPRARICVRSLSARSRPGRRTRDVPPHLTWRCLSVFPLSLASGQDKRRPDASLRLGRPLRQSVLGLVSSLGKNKVCFFPSVRTGPDRVSGDTPPYLRSHDEKW